MLHILALCAPHLNAACVCVCVSVCVCACVCVCLCVRVCLCVYVSRAVNEIDRESSRCAFCKLLKLLSIIARAASLRPAFIRNSK